MQILVIPGDKHSVSLSMVLISVKFINKKFKFKKKCGEIVFS